MEIVCNGCGRRYRISDDKMPRAGKAAINCPNCRERIVIEGNDGPGDTLRVEKGLCAASSPSMETMPAPDVFAPGARAAMLYSDDFNTLVRLEKIISDMGYEVRCIKDGQELASRMRYHAYDLVLLHRGGIEPDAVLSDILQAIHAIPMEFRREGLAVLIDPGVSRHDYMKAFSMGLDLVMSPLDLPDLENILLEAFSRKKARYRIFFESMANGASNKAA